MSIAALKQLVPVVAIYLLVGTGCAATPDYTIAHLYDHQWIDSSRPDSQQTTADIAHVLAEYDVVIFGEFHGHPGIHLAQLQLMEQMHQLRPGLSLSLEQFERDTQAIIDDYLDSRIGEQTLRHKARAWDNYPSSYRPLMEYAKQHQLDVIASNAPKNAVVCVGKKGLEILDSMPEKDRQYVAGTIDVSDGAYKDQYMEFLNSSSAHGNSSHGGCSDEEAKAIMQTMTNRSFAAQATRDDTMAESIALHLQRYPQRQVLHLTGHFHSESFLGTVERLSKRMPELNIAVINPITLGSDGPSWSKDDLNTGTVLLLVKELPEDFVQQDNVIAWSRDVLKKRAGNECYIKTE